VYESRLESDFQEKGVVISDLDNRLWAHGMSPFFFSFFPGLLTLRGLDAWLALV
jgi:hypothetical protein